MLSHLSRYPSVLQHLPKMHFSRAISSGSQIPSPSDFANPQDNRIRNIQVKCEAVKAAPMKALNNYKLTGEAVSQFPDVSFDCYCLTDLKPQFEKQGWKVKYPTHGRVNQIEFHKHLKIVEYSCVSKSRVNYYPCLGEGEVL